MSNLIKHVVAGVAVSALALSVTAAAETLRWSSAGDSLTLDPHAQNEGPTHTLAHQIYDSLVFRNMDMELTAGLATDWYVTDDPTVWEFKLREGVTYHNGAAFTAEDVVFSIKRAQHDNAGVRGLLGTIADVIAVDDHTVHFVTNGPDPLLPNNLTNLFMMDKDWAEANNVTQVQDFAGGEETYAVRNANGTGPYRLVSREPDIRTELERNEDYWGMGMFPLEVTRIIHTPISSAATRAAALLSGEIDFLLDPPVQDLQRLENAAGITVRSAPQNRTIFFGMDIARDELRQSNVTGANPFSDVRVREAMNIAIDREAIRRVVMRGQSVPAGMIAPPFVNGYTEELDAIPAVDRDRARALLAEAGYPDGFSATLQCPNDRYINDEAICQAAVSMFGQIGLDIRLESKTRSIHFADLENHLLDFYMLGWGVPTLDSHYVFTFLVESQSGSGGAFNFTNYSNAEVDTMIQAMTSETDLDVRNQMIADVWEIVQEEMMYLPIHHQVLNWAMKDNIEFNVQAEDQPHFMYMTFK